MSELPSLDYEPNLEFDDWIGDGLPAAPSRPAPVVYSGPEIIIRQSAADGSIDENFEDELAAAPISFLDWKLDVPASEGGCYGQIQVDEEFADLAASGLLELAGEDELGRLIVIMAACRLPRVKDCPPEKLYRFLSSTLDKFVEQDYLIVYFHAGMTTECRPPAYWIYSAYKALDRKFKKNLKGLYVVHPGTFIKTVWKLLRPLISDKFKNKFSSCNNLQELQRHIKLDRLFIPDFVYNYDSNLPLVAAPDAGASTSSAGASSSSPAASSSRPAAEAASGPALAPTHQIGTSLKFIRENNPDIQEDIPPVVRYCIEFMLQPEHLATEGLFRRSTVKKTLSDMIDTCNNGELVDFEGDPHRAAVLLKAFFRHLDEPILTHGLFDEIVGYTQWAVSERKKSTQMILLEKLPTENYKLLKYLCNFLWQVADMACQNKMTASNLALVFGPNLMWPPEGHLTMHYITPVNQFTEYLLNNCVELFVV